MTARPLRITHVVTNAEFAGTERYVVEVSAQLQERGHDVAIIGGKPESMRALVPPAVRWREGTTAPQALRTLTSDGRRDIVHSHVAKSDFVALAAAPLTGGARVSTRHITAPRGYTPLARRLGHVVRAALATEIAVSRWTSDQLDRPTDVVLLNGVQPQPDADAPREDVVLLAQRLDPEKDTATALHAWARSGLADRNWTLRVAGAGVELPMLTALAAELGITGSTRFDGWLAVLADSYRSASIFLAPAPTEPCGLSILEAMAQGLPVIAAASGGTLETVGSHPDAVLFPAGDVDAAAAQLRRLADDPTRRESYGVALRDLQRRSFSIEAHVDGLEQVYLDAVTRRIRPPRRRDRRPQSVPVPVERR